MIKIIVFDVDGTLTDGGIIISGDGVETKRFSDADGLIMRLLPELGYTTVILTGRVSASVEVRAKDLHISKVFHGISDKVESLKAYCAEIGIELFEVAYIGNDLNDYVAMKICGFKACPSDAAPPICTICDYVSQYSGGHGAVRDVLEYLLKHEGKWNDVLMHWGIKE